MATFLLIVLLAILLGDVGHGLDINITVLDTATTQGAGNFKKILLLDCINYNFLYMKEKKNVQLFITVCLDGSPPAYYFDRGFDTGLSNWIIFLEVIISSFC